MPKGEMINEGVDMREKKEKKSVTRRKEETNGGEERSGDGRRGGSEAIGCNKQKEEMRGKEKRRYGK